MKYKNELRTQILLRMVNKSNQMMDHIIMLNAHIGNAQSKLYIDLAQISLLVQYNSTLDKKHMEEYKNILTEHNKSMVKKSDASIYERV